MPLGMGFWDYLSDSQIEQDAINYPKNRTDRDVKQSGTVRVARYAGSWSTNLVANQDYMILGQDQISGIEVPEPVFSGDKSSLPPRVKIPHTNGFIELSR